MAVILVLDHLVDPGTGLRRLVATEDHLLQGDHLHPHQGDHLPLEDQDHQEDQLHQDQREEDQEGMVLDQEETILNLLESNLEERETMEETPTEEDQEEILVAKESSLPVTGREDVPTVC